MKLSGENFRNLDHIDCEIFAFKVKKTKTIAPSPTRFFGCESSS